MVVSNLPELSVANILTNIFLFIQVWNNWSKVNDDRIQFWVEYVFKPQGGHTCTHIREQKTLQFFTSVYEKQLRNKTTTKKKRICDLLVQLQNLG